MTPEPTPEARVSPPPRRRISILPAVEAQRIAAGEVVERPVSVVKELVDNAIDAGARHIRVEIQAGGLNLIRVVDDGSGIPASEAELAFGRHATSKISTVEDLGHLSTLGFRGEALPSIAAASRLELLTRSAEEEGGLQLHLEGGVLVDRSAKGCPVGTVVTVRQLFYNQPARLKFLRGPTVEASHVAELVNQYALGYPKIRFRLAVDGKEPLHSPGSGEVLDAIRAVYGPAVARGMIAIAAESGQSADSSPLLDRLAVRVVGVISQPQVSRSSRGYISLFVNHRWIQSRQLAFAIEQAYDGLLPEGRHPVAVLHLGIDPRFVDVNVHPTKREVRFTSERDVFGAVQRAVRATLTASLGTPHLSAPLVPAGHGQQHGGRSFSSSATPPWQALALAGSAPPAEQPGASRPDATEPSLLAPVFRQSRLPALRVLGQVGLTYIIAEGPDGMYMIDQHRAHERIIYDRLARRGPEPGETQLLLEPLPLELDARRMEQLEAHLDLLRGLGLALEPFGLTTYLLRGVPAAVAGIDPAQAVLGLLDAVLTADDRSSAEEQAMRSVACQGALKAGRVLSHDEMRQLARELEETALPQVCPHGQPIVVHLSQSTLAKEFQRGA